MSKEAAVRAMREARYAEQAKKSANRPQAKAAPVRPALPKTQSEEATTVATPAGASDALCGHRSMNGRSCTREQGHAAKSHRYS